MPRSGELLSLSLWERLVRAGRRWRVESFIELAEAGASLLLEMFHGQRYSFQPALT